MEKFQNNIPEKSKEIKEKPPILFHASIEGEIDEFEPRMKSYRDLNEGKVVFATPDYALATMFLIRAHDGWALKGRRNDVFYNIISDEERYRKIDTGSFIYSLPSDNFKCDLNKGMGECEWTSDLPVKPVNKIFIPSAIDAMLQNGVQVFFTNKETLEEIRANKMEFDKFLINSESENKKRGINVKDFMLNGK